MDRNPRYHTLFKSDVIEAASWYDDRSPGLGNVFAAEVFCATKIAIANPEQFGQLDHNNRFVRVRRFPYVVVFEITDFEIRLYGVLHTARSFEKWNRRFG